jgi:hypothetical protein
MLPMKGLNKLEKGYQERQGPCKKEGNLIRAIQRQRRGHIFQMMVGFPSQPKMHALHRIKNTSFL